MTAPWPHLKRATPLVSISALVLDTETTGLDTQTDRVVQIGAVAMRDGKCDFKNTFDLLVNPQSPIPAQSTAIHGITDTQVKSADDFKAASRKLDKFYRPPLIIGCSIGFDLAVLKAEHARSGEEWAPPPNLDIQLLAQLVAPQLPNRSLDTLAAWLEIPTEGRHNALADAIMTAKVFRALVPKLAEISIFTYAAAKRASNRITQSAQVQGGWHDIHDETALNVRQVNEYARIDSFPYRHSVGEIMNTPPVIVKSSKTLKAVMAQLADKNISSVFVLPEKSGKPHGIFTERDLLRALAKSGAGALKEKIGTHCSRPLKGIAASEFLYKAISRMATDDVRHLAVFNEDGSICGAITTRDLLKQRSQDASILGDNIQRAASAEELATIWPELAEVARGLVFEQVDARNIAAIVSHELRALTRRACELAQAEMHDEGKGEAPQPWTMMVLGSGGRGESLLAMDQDNAIIFEKGEPGGPQDKWFEDMGTRATLILNQAGVPLCTGNIMASNPDWRMNKSLWRENIEHWITRSNPQDIMNSDIFFDAASVCGDETLLAEIEQDALTAASGSRNFIKLLSMNATNFPAILRWFGKLKTENGRVDLKRAGLMPVFSTARVLAIKHQITVNATPDRLNAVMEKEPEQTHILENLRESHRIFLELILKQQLRDLDAGIPLSNSVSPETFSGFEREELRWALNEVQAIPDVLGGAVAFS